jgi:hypothetical protein
MISLVGSVILVGCNQIKFTPSSGLSIFGNKAASTTTSPIPTGTGISTPGSGSATGFGVSNDCSNVAATAAGTTAYQAGTLEVRVYLKSAGLTGTPVCQIDDEKAFILANGAVDLSSCNLDTTQTYDVTLIDPAHPTQDLFAQGHSLLPFAEIQFANSIWGPVVSGSSSGRGIASNGGSQGSGSLIYILYDTDPTLTKGGGPAMINAGNSAGQCSVDASPLIISLAATDIMPPLNLSAPGQGVMFNIMGENAFPQANEPLLISWFTNTNYGFLTLPNEKGLVLGVDQLFGNNTLGPDGKFAANGFLALAKYDENQDGVIDEQDSIFEDLRIWVDENKDGVAQISELKTLKEVGITSIKVTYDANFQEKDIYGNQIIDKSSALDAAGGQHMVFDLWFNISTDMD